MKEAGKLTITTPNDRELVMTRVFNAPRHLVFDAYTKPELLKRWLFGPDGWTFACSMCRPARSSSPPRTRGPPRT